jgi:hypothetical protein
MDLGIAVPQNKPDRKPNPRYLSLKQAIRIIDERGYDEEIRSELIRRIGRFPQNTYEHFLKNIDRHVEEANRNRIKKNKSIGDDSFTA